MHSKNQCTTSITRSAAGPHKIIKSYVKMTSVATEKNSIRDIFESLKVVRNGTEDDPELRSSDDGKVWGVKMMDEPSRPTYVLYAGLDAKDLACEAADYEMDDEDDDEEEEEDEEEDQ